MTDSLTSGYSLIMGRIGYKSGYVLKILTWIYLAAAGLGACAAPQSIDPAAAQAALLNTWQTDQHIVWELEWPAAPIGGPLTVETWRAGSRYRYEILESATPDLVGQMLMFDGQQAWHDQRFDSEPPLLTPAATLSPVSDAFTLIDQFLTRPAQTATQEMVQLGQLSTQKITLTFADGDSLSLWRDQKTNLPIRLLFSSQGQQASLQARTFEPLPDPPPGLFAP